MTLKSANGIGQSKKDDYKIKIDVSLMINRLFGGG